MALASMGNSAGRGASVTPTTRAGYGNYNKARDIAKNVMPTIIKPAEPKYTVREPSAGLNPPTVAETSSAPSYSGGTDDIVNQIKSLLKEQQEQANKYYQTLYEQQVAKNNQDWEANRNQINKNFMRGRNYLNQLYGDSSTGPGISNQARNYQNWQSNLASARQNRTNNDATALSQLNMNKANTASQLAQGWYNYVLPVYTNRQQTLDDYDYRRYLASL